MTRSFPARYNGFCKQCKNTISVGESITKHATLGYVHVECPDAPATKPQATSQPKPQPKPQQKRTNRRPSSCDKCGEFLAAGQGHLWRCMGEASGCMKHYDDDDGGWHVTCLDTEECNERRTEQVRRRKAHDALSTKFAKSKRDLEDEFIGNGTYPDPKDGQLQLDGEEIAMDNGRTRLYGGGEWCVIDKDGGRIWWVRNNGADGDAWDRSNVRTGGAGAIGRYLPYSDELEARVRANAFDAVQAALLEFE